MTTLRRSPRGPARRSLGSLAAAAALLVVPAAAHADVYLSVPSRFLGGPIAPAVPVAPAATSSAAPSGTPLNVAATPPADAGLLGYPCDTDQPADCMDWTDPGDFTPPPGTPDADPGSADPPAGAAVPQVPSPATAGSVAGGLTSPAPQSWLPWQTPLLRWRASARTAVYNVQVFRGTRLVLSAWPRRNRLRVPAGVLEQGRTYVWVVWAARGLGAAPRYAATPIGRSTFEVTLRPRLVFHGPGGAPGTTVAEVRPHIPLGRARLVYPGAPPVGAPAAIAFDATGLVSLPIPPRAAERLGAVLLDRGPTPPLGLRAP